MPLIDGPYNTINSIPLVEQSSTPTTPAAGKRTVFVKSDGLYTVDDAGLVVGPFGAAEVLNDYINIQDQKTQNTQGGTFTAGAWRTRDLNTEVSDTGGHASVASNQITLAAGTYTCCISAPAFNVQSHQAQLYNVTAGAVIFEGTSEYVQSGNYNQTRSIITGKFILAGSTVLEVRHYAQNSKTDNGFGVASNFTTEVYTIAEFWKVA